MVLSRHIGRYSADMRSNEKILLGKRIRHLRSRLGLTQDIVAEQAQISAKYLSNIERGRENPTVDTLLRLAHALKVEPWEMFLLDQENQDSRALRGKIGDLLGEAEDGGKLLLILKILRAAIH